MFRATRPSFARRTMVAALVLLISGVAAAHAQQPAGAEDPATGFAGTTDVPAGALTVHVDDDASTTGVDGTAAHPFPTIDWAMAAVNSARASGYTIRVVIAPGTYRQSLVVSNAGTNPPPLFIEAETPGTVRVTGADVETRWTPVEGRPGVVAAPWTTNWGLSPVPNWGDSADAQVPDGARRRENVFIDGKPLQQVLTSDALRAGTFFVDEAGDQLLMMPPTGTDLSTSTVEVARRTSVLQVSQTRDVTIRGITFEAGAPAFENHMAYITNSADILVEDTTFRHSSWHGLGFSGVGRLTVRDSSFVENGGNGVNTNSVTDAVIEGNEISRNNVRGWAFGWSGWSVAGSKNLRLANAVFRGNTYVDNRARGLWLDTDIQHVLVDGEHASGNYKDGILIEAAQGPITVREGTYVKNWGAGLAFGPASGVTIERSTMANNGLAAIYFEHDRIREFTDRMTGEAVVLRDFADLTFVDNTIESDGSHIMGYTPLVATRWIPIQDWRALLAAGAITASGNTWNYAPQVIPFWIKGDTSFTLDEWSARTGDGVAPAATTTTTTEATTTTTSTTTTTVKPTTTTTAPRGPGNSGGNANPGNNGRPGRP